MVVSIARQAAFLILVAALLQPTNWGVASAQINGPVEAVPASYFGMHIHTPLDHTPWPDLPFTNWRLWDTVTTWANLEPQKGEWYFQRLDRLVALAAQHHVEVLLCLGQTPAWASSNPAAPPADRQGQTAPPKNLEDWRNYVRTVVRRYRGKIHAYEIWNEPNLDLFYSGDIHTMVELTREAAQIIHSTDPTALVVSPSFTGMEGVQTLREFFRQGGAQYVDVVGYHFYVTPDAPEQIPVLAQKVHSAMAAYHIQLPLWNTEIGWSKPKDFANDYEASAYVARSLLLSWASGIARFYWYAWDNHGWVTLELTDEKDLRANANAFAYKTMESWMLGKRVESCAASGDGTWVCRLSGALSDAYIFWNPAHAARLTIPTLVANRKGFWTITDLTGHAVETAPPNVKADMQPRLAEFHPL